jgi:hypothetical protein
VTIAPGSQATSDVALPSTKERKPESVESPFAAFEGSYSGEFWSEQEMRPGRTEFGGAAEHGGTYSFVKDGMIFRGDLVRCEVSSAVELACAWEDELRAAGHASFTFEEDHRGFAGLWWEDGDEENGHPWTGVRDP